MTNAKFAEYSFSMSVKDHLVLITSGVLPEGSYDWQGEKVLAVMDRKKQYAETYCKIGIIDYTSELSPAQKSFCDEHPPIRCKGYRDMCKEVTTSMIAAWKERIKHYLLVSYSGKDIDNITTKIEERIAAMG